MWKAYIDNGWHHSGKKRERQAHVEEICYFHPRDGDVPFTFRTFISSVNGNRFVNPESSVRSNQHVRLVFKSAHIHSLSIIEWM
jgi:hypothetical protein